MFKKYSKRNRRVNRKEVPSPKRTLKSEKRKTEANWGSIFRTIRSAVVFGLILGLLSLLGYYLFGLYQISVIKPHCSACTISFTESTEVESSLFVFESPSDGSIVGAWVVINNKESGKMIVIYVPGGVYMNDYSKVLNSYVQTSNLKYVGNLISPKKALSYELWQLTSSLGLGISNYTVITPDSFKAFRDMNKDFSSNQKDNTYANLYNKPLSGEDLSEDSLMLHAFIDSYSWANPLMNFDKWKVFIQNLDTNLSQSELIGLMNQLKAKMGNGSLEIIDTGHDKYITKYLDTKLDRQIPVLDVDELDQSINHYIESIAPRKVSTELAKVEIYNASDQSGLAYRYARKLNNSGVNVIRFENSPKKYTDTAIYVPKGEGFESSLALIEKVVGGKYSVLNTRPEFITTGDIIVILGNDRENDNSNF